jgi:hypothetical protein
MVFIVAILKIFDKGYIFYGSPSQPFLGVHPDEKFRG